MKTHPNEGLRKVYWAIAIVVILLIGLGAVLWWYDAEWLYR
ncbi:hypothetical protein GCM10010885_03520 [Alicyclobacillus cellulosilyticus]|uniref:Uncharacterized protein n=1 Tax=Alicyclobacillus cellulosilyticus TaxID=1003997 RepID=A0A917K162_9BACL|nr:hypothetical protein [Alicyclobacillus cellulosilyticus]GGI97247.1 hypothetical protein GCM10010885_03520 [Alicyclobacillus cellulosilyticus]